MKILFLFPYPVGQAASQRFRFEQYFQLLSEKKIDYDIAPFMSLKTWRKFYKKGFIALKMYALVIGFFKRFWKLISVSKYDYIFIHREVFPIGPPVFEWIISKVLGKKIIYDFDDAIWIPNSSESNRFFSPLKTHSNVFPICKWSYKVSVGNDYLLRAVQPHNKNVSLNPTTIDTIGYHNRLSEHNGDNMVIGWTGSHSTNKYLTPFFEVVKKLKQKHDFTMIVISDEIPTENQELFEFVKWKKESEIEDLLRFNIGVMPLTHDPWSEGKCGFKALQYMALGIPALVSPVGVNEQIVDDDINGYVCRDQSQWFDKLTYLLENKDKIKKMGSRAREKIETHYSVKSNASNFIHLFS